MLVNAKRSPLALLAPLTLVAEAAKTGRESVWDDAPADEAALRDPYIRERRPRSVLCRPIAPAGGPSIVLYLENRALPGAFTPERLEVLRLLSSQVAVSMENVRLYERQREALGKARELAEVRDRLLRQYGESRLAGLQERMRPHFFLNAINTIQSLLRSDPGTAERAAVMLADIYRFIVDRSFQALVPFAEEWRFTRDYLEFERLRFPDSLSFKMSMEGSFDDVLIPPLCVQPLAENAIRHGIRRRPGPGAVLIDALRGADGVRVTVSDDGAGLATADPYRRTLGNIRDRLRYHFEGGDVLIHDRPEGGVEAVIAWREARPENRAGIETGNERLVRGNERYAVASERP